MDQRHISPSFFTEEMRFPVEVAFLRSVIWNFFEVEIGMNFVLPLRLHETLKKHTFFIGRSTKEISTKDYFFFFLMLQELWFPV